MSAIQEKIYIYIYYIFLGHYYLKKSDQTILHCPHYFENKRNAFFSLPGISGVWENARRTQNWCQRYYSVCKFPHYVSSNILTNIYTPKYSIAVAALRRRTLRHFEKMFFWAKCQQMFLWYFQLHQTFFFETLVHFIFERCELNTWYLIILQVFFNGSPKK